MKLCVAITTIQPPTTAVRTLAARLEPLNAALVVAGDRKGPAAYDLPGAVFLGLQEQQEGPFELARQLPTGHYCRKNVAYLECMRRGAACIYETDDDNAPLPSWRPRDEMMRALRTVQSRSQGASRSSRWINVYRYFTTELIWPRGLPLDEVRAAVPPAELTGEEGGGVTRRVPIQQGLANGSPDVDAIWRLTMDRPFDFTDDRSVWLAPGNWCPFNSQATWWWPVSYPLMYVPSHCSFRMCDIWRSFVAQRCLWELGCGLVFHAPEVMQERNPHDFMRDFHDEVSGYERNKAFVRVLEQTELQPGEGQVAGNLLCCYQALVREGFFPADEVVLLKAWLRDVLAHLRPEARLSSGQG